jgi:plastocyanin
VNFCICEKKTVSGAVNLITRQIQSVFMKKYIGLFILVIVLVIISGCTQQAKTTAPATTIPTTVITTPVPTTEETPLPTTVPTTMVVTTTLPVNVTAEITTVATPQPSKTPSTKITTIHIRNNTYVPNELTVLPGTGIRWINDDSVIHIVKASGDHKGMFTSSEIINGGQYGYTFGETPGSYEFTDPAYPDMKGTIIIKKGESVLGASTVKTSATTP